jgi:hypothetical protein
MPNANWQAEVNAALKDEQHQEKAAQNIFKNPALARYWLASGIVAGLIAAAVYGVSTLDGLSPDDRTQFEGFAIIAGMASFVQVFLSVAALLMIPKPQPRFQRKDGPRAIGW